MAKKCTNGTFRTDVLGRVTLPRDPCLGKALPGHIFCEDCRRLEGGYFVRQPVFRDRPAGTLAAELKEAA